jgi:3-oxoadipate enol-lactonase
MLIETRLGRLFVEEQGAGTPVVLWHSLLCDGGMWRHQVSALSARHRVINIDAPGHGRSAKIDRRFTMEDCADAAVEILDALAIERAHWIGLSWGAMTGMRLALRHPERVRSLALLSASAEKESKRKLAQYLVMEAVGVALPGMPMVVDRLAPIFFSRRARDEQPGLIRDFDAHVLRMDERSIRRTVRAVMVERTDLRPRLREIQAPAIVMVGTEDVATPIARARVIAEGIAGAQYREISGAGHLCALEAPEAVNEALLAFLARLS